MRGMETTQSHRLETRRESIAATTPAKKKSDFGQFFTPWPIASFMAGLFGPVEGQEIRLLDAGAGVGSLTAAFAATASSNGAVGIDAEAWEVDPALWGPLEETLGEVSATSRSQFRGRAERWDFIIEAAAEVAGGMTPRFTHAILNPPYKKMRSASEHRKILRDAGIETTNFYAAFVALAIQLLKNDGEIVAITPRSFCNGAYFKPFRRLIIDKTAVVRFHVFESRTSAFKGDEVLQENVIFHLKKGAPQGNVVISASTDSTFSDVKTREVPFAEVVPPDDPESIFHLVADEADNAAHEDRAARFTNSLSDLGLGVATGPVVDFRLREHMTDNEADPEAVPLIYPWHAEAGFCSHPRTGAKKPNYIRQNNETRAWLMPSGWYVLVRRMSSKEERRRIVPTIFDPSRMDKSDGMIAFENHLNVLHSAKAGMDPEIAKGLAVWLGSTAADEWLRRFNGHTQVNAGDLRALKYPDLDTLRAWGRMIGDALPSQEGIDGIVEG